MEEIVGTGSSQWDKLICIAAGIQGRQEEYDEALN